MIMHTIYLYISIIIGFILSYIINIYVAYDILWIFNLNLFSMADRYLLFCIFLVVSSFSMLLGYHLGGRK